MSDTFLRKLTPKPDWTFNFRDQNSSLLFLNAHKRISLIICAQCPLVDVRTSAFSDKRRKKEQTVNAGFHDTLTSFSLELSKLSFNIFQDFVFTYFKQEQQCLLKKSFQAGEGGDGGGGNKSNSY